MKNNVIIKIAILIALFFSCSCKEKEGPAESLGKEIDKAIEKGKQYL